MKTKVAYIGVFVALALIFSYIETLIPFNVGFPGFKFGFANIIILIMLYKYGIKETFLVGCIKSVVSGLLFSNITSVAFGLCGTLCSIIIMYFVKKSGTFNVISNSILGAVMHNVGQLVVAIFVLESFSIIYYLPILLASGFFAGLIVGILGNEMIKRIKV